MKKQDKCAYLKAGGVCSHPGKRGTKGADGKQYCTAKDAAKEAKK